MRGSSAASGVSTNARCAIPGCGTFRRFVAIVSRAIEQQVEIDRPRGPAAAVFAAERALDGFQAVEYLRPAIRSVRQCATRFRNGWFHSAGASSGSIAGDSTTGDTRTTRTPCAPSRRKRSGEVVAAVAEVRPEPEVNVHERLFA